MGRHIGLTAWRFGATMVAVVLSVLCIVWVESAAAAAGPVEVRIGAGTFHSAILGGDGRLWTFGDNRYGQLGVATNSGNAEAANPTPVVAMTDVVDISVGAGTTMAIKADRTLWAFGSNASGELGIATNFGTQTPNPTPTQIMSGVRSASTGGAHSLVVKTDGTLWSFGRNFSGELGRTLTGGASHDATPVQIMSGVASAEAGGGFSLVLKTDGTLWGFGANVYGELGTGTTATIVPPTQLMTGVKAIAAGDSFSLALKTDGTLWAAGLNAHAQLGLPPNGVPNPVRTQVMTGVARISAGDIHSMVVKTDGSVWTFGSNSAGEHGTTPNNTTVPPSKGPAQIMAGTAVAGGGLHSLVLQGDSTVWSFGLNDHGQLGRSTNLGTQEPNPTPNKVFSAATSLPTGNAALTAMAPARLVETRRGPDYLTIDGQFQGGGRRPAGSTLIFTVAGRGGVPANAQSAMLNLTAVNPSGPGYLTVWHCDIGPLSRPTSNLNYLAGQVVPNAALAWIASAGRVCITTSTETDLVIDVNGFVPAGVPRLSVEPFRLLDTRIGPEYRTTDGQFWGIGRRPAGSTLQLTAAGRGPAPGTALAVFLNVTAVAPSAEGYLTVYPCSAARTLASNVNYRTGAVVANAVLSGAGPDGKVCIYTSAETDLVVDINGFVPAEQPVVTVPPARLLETRIGPTELTVDGQFQGLGRRAGGSTIELAATGRGGVPEGVHAVVLNVTAVGPTGPGFLTVFPCGTSRPLASNLNYVPGDVVPNLVLAQIGTAGKVCIYTQAPVDLVVDVDGYVPFNS